MDPEKFTGPEHQYMTTLLTDSVMQTDLPAKALTMENVVNVNTPETKVSGKDPIEVHFLVLGERGKVQNSLSVMKSMMSRGALQRQMIIHNEDWFDVGLERKVKCRRR